ncbi:hypothetical protein [Sedimenticola hydrogenitrophicus]|uniref:hypothetical protein n=1 Tax=Sedimenticola hydrogenitrophicus TaxID=2967975 RepID=UPI0021A7C573|nr:hypothetical protein [Sedimenticola hydrogenitrophicus]
MKYAPFLLMLFLITPAVYADISECDMATFPDFWADAQDRVDVLKLKLSQAERKNPFSESSTSSFQDSLKLCEDKHSSIWGGSQASGSAGVVPLMMCQAKLICSRISIIEAEW